jgi:hypothetical protein
MYVRSPSNHFSDSFGHRVFGNSEVCAHREVDIAAEVHRGDSIIKGDLGDAKHGAVGRDFKRKVFLLVALGLWSAKEPSAELVPNTLDLALFQ